MTLKEAYYAGKEKLSAAGVQECDLDAFYLLEHVTGITRAGYYADEYRALTDEQIIAYHSLISQRAKRVPLQHLTKVQEFMGLPFYVNRHVLIPRQDTELLVETALAALDGQSVRILDMCTGSGCILISIMAHSRSAPGQISGTGADISAEALAVAAANARNLQVAAEFIESDLFENVSGLYDIIVSNPPYIRTADIDRLAIEVKNHDPLLALDGKADGLFFYREIVKQSREYLVKGGRLIMEIGCDQGLDVSRMMTAQGFSDVIVKKDLAGLDRVVSGVYDKRVECKKGLRGCLTD